MAAPPVRKAPARNAGPPARLLEWAALLLCVALALWVQRRSLAAFFSLDDFLLLERAQGILPPHPIVWWRLLSGRAFFGTALRMFGTDPFPYHAVLWIGHAANVALLFLLVRRWGGSIRSATVAAGLFGVSQLFGVVLDQVVGIEVVLALLFVLLAFRVVDPGRPRTLLPAGALSVAALLCKESVLLLPAVLLLPIASGATPKSRALAAGVLLLPGVVLMGALLAARVGAGLFGGEAYATGYGANLFHNAMTYASWIADFRRLAPELGGASPAAWRWGVWIVGAALAIAALTWRNSARATAGVVWWGLALVPVLPLLHHTYQQYTYTALAGLAIVVGEAWEVAVAWVTRRARGDRPPVRDGRRGATPPTSGFRSEAPALAATLLLVLSGAVASDALFAQRWSARVPGVDLLLDPQLRRSEFTRTVATTLGPSLAAGQHRRLVFFVPQESTQRLRVATGEIVTAEGPPSDNLLTSMLDGGRVIRVLHPGVDSVTFADRWSPAYRGFDIVINAPSGLCINLGQGPEAHRRLVEMLLRGGFGGVALEHLRVATAEYPGDSVLAAMYRQALRR